MDKRGVFFNRETMFIAMGILVGILAIMAMITAAGDVLDTEALFKKYLARDLALIVGAVYSAPGNVSYEYQMDERMTYYVRVVRDRVYVSSDRDFGEGETFSYRIAYDKNVDFRFTQYGNNVPDDPPALVKRPPDTLPSGLKVVIKKTFLAPPERPLLNVSFTR